MVVVTLLPRKLTQFFLFYHMLAVLGMLGKHQEALSLREHALNTYADQLGEHPFTGSLCNYLGNDCLALNKYDKAVEYFSRALSIGRECFNQETARTFHNLGEAYKMKVSHAIENFNLDWGIYRLAN